MFEVRVVLGQIFAAPSRSRVGSVVLWEVGSVSRVAKEGVPHSQVVSDLIGEAAVLFRIAVLLPVGRVPYKR